MTTIAEDTPGPDGRAAGAAIVAGIVLAALTEAIAGTVLSLGRNDMIGDTHATPDEFAWLDVGYTTAKFIGFMTAAWLMARADPRRIVIVSTLVMGITCGVAALTDRLDLLVAFRMIQSLSGGTLLVAGQTIFFLAYKTRNGGNRRVTPRQVTHRRQSELMMRNSRTKHIRRREPAAGMARFFRQSNRDRCRKLASGTISQAERHQLLDDLAEEMDAFKREARCSLSPTAENGSIVPGSPDRV